MIRSCKGSFFVLCFPFPQNSRFVQSCKMQEIFCGIINGNFYFSRNVGHQFQKAGFDRGVTGCSSVSPLPPQHLWGKRPVQAFSHVTVNSFLKMRVPDEQLRVVGKTKLVGKLPITRAVGDMLADIPVYEQLRPIRQAKGIRLIGIFPAFCFVSW